MKNGVKADFGTNLRTMQDNQSVIGKLPGNFSKIEIFFSSAQELKNLIVDILFRNAFPEEVFL